MMGRLSLLLLTTTAACAGDGLKWKQLPPLPDPPGVAAPFAGVANGALVVAGGANFPDKMPWDGGKKVWHDRIWVLEKPNGRWKSAGRLPRPLAYGISLTVSGRLLCIGGSDAERHYPDVFSLGISGSGSVSATVLPALPVPLANAAGAVGADDVVYVACGSSESGEKSAVNRVFSANVGVRPLTWTEAPPLPAAPRILPVAAAIGRSFYLFGGAALEEKDGRSVRRYLNDAWRYTAGVGWERLADLPKPAVGSPSPAPVVNGRILLLSGDDGSLAGFTPAEKHPGFPRRILAFDPALNRWRHDGNVPAPRVTAPCAQWNDLHVIPSGEVRPGVRSAQVWAFGP